MVGKVPFHLLWTVAVYITALEYKRQLVYLQKYFLAFTPKKQMKQSYDFMKYLNSY